MLTNHHNDEHGLPAADISKYLLIEGTALCRADFGLVFTDRECFEALADKAAELYHLRYFPTIVVSGGRGKENSGVSEAHIVKHHLLMRKVPEAAIVTELASETLRDSVLMTRHLVGMLLGGTSKNIIGIGNAVTGRRMLMTMKRHWPEAFAMAANVNPFEGELDGWATRPLSYSVVQKEFTVVASGRLKGDIQEINLANINLTARKQQFKAHQCQLENS